MGLFSSYSELRRLRKRVKTLERELKAERERHLLREDALVNVALTAHGHRGVSEPSVEVKPKKTNTERPTLTAEDEATLAYYKQCARDAGLDEGEAEKWFLAYLRGEEPTFVVESEQ